MITLIVLALRPVNGIIGFPIATLSFHVCSIFALAGDPCFLNHGQINHDDQQHDLICLQNLEGGNGLTQAYA